jgi:hypothetical protein
VLHYFFTGILCTFPSSEDNKMSQVDDLSSGDSTPKLAKASIKDIALALNRISYAFKTPDSSVAPDGFQLSSDGNLSLGGVPDTASTNGRTFTVVNSSSSTSADGNAILRLSSSNASAVVAVQSGSVAGGLTAYQFRRGDGATMAAWRYTPSEAVLKLDMRNGSSSSQVMRVNPTGEVTLGDTASVIAKFQILAGTAALNGSENAVFLQSSAPTTTPVLISGTNGGSTQIAGGNNLNGGGRGGQIDLNSVSWSAAPGTIVFRAGTNTDGLASAEVGRFTPLGRLGVGFGSFDPGCTIHGRSENGVRARVMIEGINDYAGFTARRANGSYSALTNVKNQDSLLFLNAHGHNGSSNTSSNYSAGPAFSCIATEDWTQTANGTAWVLNTTPNGTSGNAVPAMYWAHNGNVGINNTNPQSKLVVSNANGGNSLEISPSSTIISQLAYDRSGSVYTQMQNVASRHTWNTGPSTNVQTMLLESNGNLAVNTTVASGGTGNTLVEGKVIIGGGSGNITYLTLQGGTDYAGLKFKSGAMHPSSGGVNNYDITVRPGSSGTGVAQVADKVLMRFEAAQSLTPRLILQPDGGTQQVIVGDPTNAASNAKFVIQNEAAFNYPGLTIAGKDMSNAGALPSADLVIQRDGAVSSTAGLMPWIQLESKSASFAGNNAVAIGGAANSFQVWNFVSNAWFQNLIVAPNGLTSNVSALINGGITIRGPSAGTGNIVLQSNTSLGVAHWISSKTSGYLHVGGNGAAEPTIGAMTIASSGKTIGLWPLNETQTTYSYSHGGTVAGLHINNTDTTINAQAHLFLASGQTNIAGSSVGTVSWVLPNIASNGTARIVNIGAETDANHTAAQAAGRFVISTKNNGDSTAVPRFRIRSSGNATLGSTLNDTSRLYVFNEGRTGIDGITVDTTDTPTSANSSFVSSRGGTSGYAMYFFANNVTAGTITHPSASSTAYGTSSDRRMKKNIVDAPEAGSIIDNIRVVSHDFIADDYHVPFGFVAQELNETYPSAVVRGDDELDIGPNSKIWQVDNSKLVPLLVKEIQNLRNDNTSIKRDLAELKELVNLLLNKAD